jgi:protein-L-isoaspartate(D-aspartate) O-methyltransferase
MRILLSELSVHHNGDELIHRRIGYNATISAPHMHAHAAENLLCSLPSDSEGGAILDVGSGSGYRKLTRAIVAQADGVVTAVFHHLAPNARVVGIEHIKELAEWSKENLRKDGIEVGEGRVEIVHGDGRLGELPKIGRKLRLRIA